MAVIFVIFPQAFIFLPRFVFVFAEAIGFVLLELAFVFIAVCVDYKTLAMHFSIAPVSLIGCAIWPCLLTEAMFLAKT